MHLILLSNDRIFRALSDGIYKIFSVLDPKNSFSVINQSTLRDKTSYQEKETFDIMSNIFLKYRGGGYKVQQVGVYKVHLVRVYKVSLFFGFGKWVFIRSSFFNFHMVSHFFFKNPVYTFFAKMRRYKISFFKFPQKWVVIRSPRGFVQDLITTPLYIKFTIFKIKNHKTFI